MNKKVIIIFAILLVAIVLGWAFIESSKPLQGTQFPDEGRDHIKIGEKVDYKTNPPTSGKHYNDWIKTGVYEAPLDDRNLLHSLEHGYIIMYYNCNVKQALIKSIFAQEQPTSSSAEASQSAKLPETFNSQECKKLVRDLTTVYNQKSKKKLVVMPRSNMDSRIILTAWRWMEKLDSFDSKKISQFIDDHRDKGPEQTIE